MICISNVTVAVAFQVFFNGASCAYAKTVLVSTESNPLLLGTVAAIMHSMYWYPQWADAGQSLAPQSGDFPVALVTAALDMGILVTPAMPIPPNYFLTLTMSWANIADALQLIVLSPDTLVSYTNSNMGSTGVDLATGEAWIQFTKGWPAEKSFIIVRRNSTIDIDRLVDSPTATLTVCLDRTATAETAIAKSTVPLALRTDFAVPMTVSFTLRKIAHGGTYGRAFSFQATFAAQESVFMPTSGSVFAVLYVMFPLMPVLTGVMHEQSLLFLSPTATTTLTCGTGSALTQTTPVFDLFAHGVTNSTYAKTKQALGFQYVLKYSDDAVAAGVVCTLLTTNVFYTEDSSYRDLLATQSNVIMIMRAVSPTKTRLNRFLFSGTLTNAPFVLLPAKPKPESRMSFVPTANLSMSTTGPYRYLATDRKFSTVAPVYLAANAAVQGDGYVGLGESFALAVSFKVNAVPSAEETSFCFSLPTGTTTSLGTTVAFHTRGVSSLDQWETSTLLMKTCSSVRLTEALVEFNGASVHGDPLSSPELLGAVLPARCACTSAASGLKQTTYVVTMLISGISHDITTADSSLRPALFAAWYMDTALTAVSGEFLITYAPPPPRNRILPRSLYMGAPKMSSFAPLVQISATALSPSMSVIYSVANNALYMTSLTLDKYSDASSPYTSYQLQGTGWSKIADLPKGARYAMTVAPDDRTVFVNIDNTLLVVVGASFTIGHITCDVALPFQQTTVSTGLAATELPVFAPAINGWHLRNTASAVVLVPVGPSIVTYALSNDNTLSFLSTQILFNEFSVITAFASSQAAFGFVACLRISKPGSLSLGSTCKLLKRDQQTTIFELSTVYNDSRPGATITAVDMCFGAQTGVGPEECLAVATRIDTKDQPLISEISMVSGVSNTAILAAVVPGEPIIDMKFTSFENQIVLLRAGAVDQVLAKYGYITVLSRISDTPQYESSSIHTKVDFVLPSGSTAATHLSIPSIIASPDRETFFIAIGDPALWRTLRAMPVLSPTVTARSSVDITVSYARSGETHEFLLNSETIAMTTPGAVVGSYTTLSVATSTAFRTTMTVPATFLLTAPLYDTISPYTRDLAYGEFGSLSNSSSISVNNPLRVVSRASGDGFLLGMGDTSFPETSWFGGSTPTVIAIEFSNPVMGETGIMSIVFASPDSTHSAATWTFTQPYFQMTSQTATVTAHNSAQTYAATCTIGTPTTTITCTPQLPSIYPSSVVLRIDLIGIMSTADSVDPALTTSALSATRSATASVTAAPYAYRRPAPRPTGHFGYSHRAPLRYLPPSGVKVSWNANSQYAFCYAFSSYHRGCYEYAYKSTTITGDWTVQDNTRAAPVPTHAAAYGFQGTFVSLVPETPTGTRVGAMRFFTLSASKPLPVDHAKWYVDLPFDPDLFEFRIGGGAAHMYIVSSAEITGALVIVYNDDKEVVLLARLNPRTLRASGAANVLTRELLTRMQTPISFASPIAGDELVAVLDWTSPTELTLKTSPTTRIVFVYSSGVVRICAASIREKLAVPNRATDDPTVDDFGLTCSGFGSATETLTTSEGGLVTPTAAALDASSGQIYIGTAEGDIVTLRFAVIFGVVTYTMNSVRSLHTVCPVSALAVHPSGTMLTAACADTGSLVAVRILANTDLANLLLRSDQTLGSMVRITKSPSRDYRKADIADPYSTRDSDVVYYYARETGFARVISMSYTQHGAYLAVMGALNPSETPVIEFLRSVDETPTTVTVSDMTRGGLTTLTLAFPLQSFPMPDSDVVCTVWGPQSSSFTLVTSVELVSMPASTNGVVASINSSLNELTFTITGGISSANGIWQVTVVNASNPSIEADNELQPTIACSHWVDPIDPTAMTWTYTGSITPAWSGIALPVATYTEMVRSAAKPQIPDPFPWNLQLATASTQVVLLYLHAMSTEPLVLLDESALAKTQIYRVRLILEDGNAAPCLIDSGPETLTTIVAGSGLSDPFIIFCTEATGLTNPVRVELTSWVGSLALGHTSDDKFLLPGPLHVRPTFTLLATIRVGAIVDSAPAAYPAGTDVDITLHFDVPLLDSTAVTLSVSHSLAGCTYVGAVGHTGAAVATLAVPITLPADAARIEGNSILIARMSCTTPTNTSLVPMLAVSVDQGFVDVQLPARIITGNIFATPAMPVPFEFEITGAPQTRMVTIAAQPTFASARPVTVELTRNLLPLVVPCTLSSDTVRHFHGLYRVNCTKRECCASAFVSGKRRILQHY